MKHLAFTGFMFSIVTGQRTWLISQVVEKHKKQYQLFACDMRLDVPPKPKRKFTPHLKVLKLTDPQRKNHFQEVFKLHVSASAGVPDAANEDLWNNLKTGLVKHT